MNDSSCEFKLVITRNSESKHILFIASSMSEKQSWCSDISQVIAYIFWIKYILLFNKF